MIKDQLLALSVEEFANTITHGFGLVLSLAGFGVLIVMASLRGDPLLIAASVIYGLSLIVLYAASTIYHSATCPIRKEKLQLVDHCCIYLLIAGSYTPFLLVVMRGSFGLGLLAFVWAFAAAGTLMKVIFRGRFKAVGIASYLIMGWIGVLAIEPLYTALGAGPILLAVAGGLSYSVGVIFFGWKSLRHHHAIWHLFVLGGSIAHYCAIVIYVMP